MVLQAGPVQLGHVRFQDFFRGKAGEQPDEDGNEALGDEGVAVRVELQHALVRLRVQPHAGLAALDEGVLRLVGFVQLWKLLAQADDVFVAFRPVLEQVQFIQQVLQAFFVVHGSDLVGKAGYARLASASVARTAFWAWTLFSASRKMTGAKCSSTSSVISLPR